MTLERRALGLHRAGLLSIAVFRRGYGWMWWGEPLRLSQDVSQ